MAIEKATRKLAVEPQPAVSPIIGSLLGMIEDTRQRTLESIRDLPPERIDTPSPLSGNSIGSLLYHISAVEASWLFEDVIQQDFLPEFTQLFPYDVREESGRLTRVAGENLETCLLRMSKVREALLMAYRQMSLDDFRTLRRSGSVELTPEWVLHHLMQHEAEHRGQIFEIRLSGSNLSWE